MAAIVYGLCALTAVLCAYLLLRAYMQQRYKLLLWSGLCFVILAFNNFLLIIDKLLLPLVDLSVMRSMIALLAVLILLYGLVWDAE
jgi:hydrogenase/urease accessory protein HupE